MQRKLALLALSAALAGPAGADEILLRNGDRISGEALTTYHGARARLPLPAFRQGGTGSEPPAPTVSAWLAGANLDRFVDPRRFVYVRGSVEHDRAKDLRRRSAIGLGYGVELVQSEALTVSARGGLDYLAESRYTVSGEAYPALGWGVSATAQFNLDWESRPAEGREPTDSLLLFGVDYAW